MKKRFKILLFFFIIALFSPVMGYTDTRTEGIDVFLVLDKSLSMVEEIGEVRDYVKTSIIDRILIPGDRFLLIIFYGEAHVLLNNDVLSEDNKEYFKKTVESIRADGRFTDIGNALDRLKAAVDEFGIEGRRKYLLLITDGKQEAPPHSIYYSPDGSFNHHFLENTKIIQKEGWRIHILGIGSEQAAKEIARELSGTYSEIDDRFSRDDIEHGAGDLLSSIDVVSPVSVSRIPENRRAAIGLST